LATAEIPAKSVVQSWTDIIRWFVNQHKYWGFSGLPERNADGYVASGIWNCGRRAELVIFRGI
jgi:hypothetical protein